MKTQKQKKSFYLKASALLKSWQEVYHVSRSYADHCINVKRSSDYFDINILLKNINAGQFADEIKERITENGDEIKQDYYDSFLSFLWEQVNYELADIKEITEGSKNEHKTFLHIKEDGFRQAWPKDSKSILWADGRSGGWACFNSHGQDMADELEYFINNNYTSAGDVADDWDNNQAEDAQNYFIALSECLEEVNYIIEYVKRFNNGNKFIDFMEDQAEQILDELQTAEDERLKDEADKIDNAERASLELKAGLNEIDRYAAKYFTKEETRQKIARQVTALKSVIKNAV